MPENRVKPLPPLSYRRAINERVHVPSAQTPKKKRKQTAVKRRTIHRYHRMAAWPNGRRAGMKWQEQRCRRPNKEIRIASPPASVCLNGVTEGEGGQRQRPARHLNAEGTGRRGTYSVKVKGFVH